MAGVPTPGRSCGGSCIGAAFASCCSSPPTCSGFAARRRFPVRVRLARERVRTRSRGGLPVAAAVVFVAVGGFLFYNTHVLNTYRSSKAEQHLRAERERLYKRFERSAAAAHHGHHACRSTSIRRDGDAVITGQYVLRNKTSVPDRLHPPRPRRRPGGPPSRLRPAGPQRARRQAAAVLHLSTRRAARARRHDAHALHAGPDQSRLPQRDHRQRGRGERDVSRERAVHAEASAMMRAPSSRSEDARKKEKLRRAPRMRPPTDSRRGRRTTSVTMPTG